MWSIKTTNIEENVVVNGHKKLSALILEYKAEDGYNIYESIFFYHLQSDKIISSGHVEGFKKAKDHLYLVFCTNADGYDKITLAVIEKSAKSRL